MVLFVPLEEEEVVVELCKLYQVEVVEVFLIM